MSTRWVDVFTVRERENVMDHCSASPYDSEVRVALHALDPSVTKYLIDPDHHCLSALEIDSPRCVQFWARLDTDTSCVVHACTRIGESRIYEGVQFFLWNCSAIPCICRFRQR